MSPSSPPSDRARQPDPTLSIRREIMDVHRFDAVVTDDTCCSVLETTPTSTVVGGNGMIRDHPAGTTGYRTIGKVITCDGVVLNDTTHGASVRTGSQIHVVHRTVLEVHRFDTIGKDHAIGSSRDRPCRKVLKFNASVINTDCHCYPQQGRVGVREGGRRQAARKTGKTPHAGCAKSWMRNSSGSWNVSFRCPGFFRETKCKWSTNGPARA